MTGSTAALHERQPAHARSIGFLRHAVVEFAGSSGASADRLATIALAVSEALSNAVLHAYVGDDEPGCVVVDAHVHGGSLEVVVRDEGHGMLPRTDSPGLGLGLPLIARLAERLVISDATPGTSVQMRFAIA
ncbi:MAG: serine/threonine-protein kinase RsbW [bacterium]